MYKTCELGERSLNCCLPHGRDYVKCLLQHIPECLLSEKISICLQVPRIKSNGRDKICLQKLLRLHSTVLASPEKEMATHSSTLAWKIPCMEESGGLQSMWSRRVGDDWVTSLSLFIFMYWRRKWQPTPVFLPGESQGQGSLVCCRLWGCTESDRTEAT